ncbi:MAG: branched-chain amino acid ABC transporter permease [Dehalococcoidales bacterium]|nr:branched-chain amino acid ABC transporter permease [Dehalococcoidales bacterium]
MEQFLNIFLGGLLIGGIYSLVSMGLSLQYGVAKVLNIAHGEFLMIGAFATYWLQESGVDPLLTVVIVGPVMFLVGFLLYRTVFTSIRLRSAHPGIYESNSLLAAFGIYFIVQNIGILIWGTTPHSYTYLNTSISVAGALFTQNRIVAAAFAVVIGIAFYLFLTNTRTGKAIRAAAQDPSTAGLMGVNIDFVLALCFGFGAAMAGVAGSLISICYSLSTSMGLGYTVIAIVVVTLGGLGSIPGSFIGGFVLGIIGSAVSYWQPGLTVASYYVIFIILLLVRPKGIMGK